MPTDDLISTYLTRSTLLFQRSSIEAVSTSAAGYYAQIQIDDKKIYGFTQERTRRLKEELHQCDSFVNHLAEATLPDFTAFAKFANNYRMHRCMAEAKQKTGSAKYLSRCDVQNHFQAKHLSANRSQVKRNATEGSF